MNKFIFTTRLFKDAEVSETSSGKKLIKFSIPVDRYSKDKENKITDWHNMTYFVKAESVVDDFLVKDAVISGIASVQYREYEGKKYTDMLVEKLNIEVFASDSSDKKEIEQASEVYKSITKNTEPEKKDVPWNLDL